MRVEASRMTTWPVGCVPGGAGLNPKRLERKSTRENPLVPACARASHGVTRPYRGGQSRERGISCGPYSGKRRAALAPSPDGAAGPNHRYAGTRCVWHVLYRPVPAQTGPPGADCCVSRPPEVAEEIVKGPRLSQPDGVIQRQSCNTILV